MKRVGAVAALVVVASGALIAWRLIPHPPVSYAHPALSRTTDHPAPQAEGPFTWTIRSEAIPTLAGHEHEPGEPDGPHSLFPPSIPFVVPEDAWITGFETKVVGADPRVLHHATLYASDMPDVVCPSSNLLPDLYASSAYVTSMTLPQPYALFVKAGTTLYLSPMLHDPVPPMGPGGTYHNVSIEVLAHGAVATASNAGAYRKAEFIRLRVDAHPCSNTKAFQTFSVPSSTPQFIVGSAYDTPTAASASYTFPRAGTIIGFGANFWPLKGGRYVAGYLNDKKIVELTPTTAPPGAPWEVDIPSIYTPIPIAQGDTLRVEARYDNPTPHTIPDATAHLGIYVSYDTASSTP